MWITFKKNKKRLDLHLVYIKLIHTTSCMCPEVPTHNILAVAAGAGYV